MRDSTIQNLIAETLSGNTKAQENLYKIYKRKVNHFLLNKYSGNRDHVDDVCEVMAKIFEKLETYDVDKAKFDTWVFNLAKNYMIDKSRKNKPVYVSFTSSNTEAFDNQTFNSANTVSLDGLSQSSFTTSNCMIEPQSHYQLPDVNCEVNDSLDFLSNKVSVNDFSMLRMKYLEGYTYDEIGKEFNIDEAKVSSKLNYSKRKIKGDK